VRRLAGLVATGFPELIARDDRSTGGALKEEEATGVVRPAAEGEDTALARLDGTSPQAIVADKVMKSGKADRQATAPVSA
jgi:hypothetical protein